MYVVFRIRLRETPSYVPPEIPHNSPVFSTPTHLRLKSLSEHVPGAIFISEVYV